MEDFSAWLGQTATEGDDVVVTMDLGAGREFALLNRMVRDGTIALVDRLYIRWHYQISVRCARCACRLNGPTLIVTTHTRCFMVTVVGPSCRRQLKVGFFHAD